MKLTRLISLAGFLGITIGIGILAAADSSTTTWIGAFLIGASALLVSRYFWREGETRVKRETEAVVRRLNKQMQDQAKVDARTNERLAKQVDDVDRRIKTFSRGILEYVSQMEIDVKELDKRLAASSRATDEVGRQGKRLERSLEKADRNAIRNRDDVLNQLSGVIGVYATLQPDRPYPPFGGWAISGDCGQRLITMVLRRKPRAVIEIGSGLSTLITAQALELNGDDGLVFSLDHEEQWLEETSNLLKEHGLLHRVELFHAPLIPTPLGDETYNWYDLSQVALPEEAQLAFVDGPPQATGPMARYPALPMLWDRLAAGGVLLMDDARRPGEREAVARWEQEFSGLSVRHHADSKGTVEVTKPADGQ